MKKVKMGLVGATGMVGQAFIKVLKEFSDQKQFEISELRLFAGEQSQGKEIAFGKKKLLIGGLTPKCFDGLDYVFFSGGDELCREWALKAVGAGAWAIDNSAAFRMHPDVLLVVPEVNGDLLAKLRKPQIIANPNCSTIQLVLALSPLQKAFGIQRVTVATYQAASGAGREARDELVDHIKKKADTLNSKYFARSLAYNVVPQIGSFDEYGFTSEEQKIMRETKKILRDSKISMSAFSVRVPVLNGHSEAVWVELKKEVSYQEISDVLAQAPGVQFESNPTKVQGLTPKEISGQNSVYIGRLHQDLDSPQQWLMWVVADNIRKGAAYNAVQIAKAILDLD
jgi:aspartate-semialdehyde dehydrogenase